MGLFAAIRAVEVYLPASVEKNDMSSRVAKKLGIFERPVAGAEESSGDMARQAAERLFSAYAIDRSEVDFVLLCTHVPDYLIPATACILQDQLHLPKHCGALDFNLGCSGYTYGLSLAKGLIEGGMASNVLLLTTGVYSKYVNEKDKVSRPLFGDAAAATLVSAVSADQPLLDSFVFGTDGSGFEQLMIPAGGSRNPAVKTKEIFTTDAYGSTRSNYEIFMDGEAVAAFMLREVPPLVEKILEKSGLAREQIDYYVFHQPNAFMLKYIQTKCALSDMNFFNQAERTGNTMASSIPIGIAEVIKKQPPEQLSRVMLAGFGLGLSWAGCLADLTHMLPGRQDEMACLK